MIIIIDLESFTFSHEEFNAGTIYQIAVAHPDKDIVYYAEREQIKYVTKLIKVKNVKNICFQKLSLLSKIREEKGIGEGRRWKERQEHREGLLE